MRELRLSSRNLHLLMGSVLDHKLVQKMRIKASGYSMSPFIRNGQIITIKPIVNKKILFGDIVVAVIQKKREKILVHRVIGKKNKQYLLKGDNLDTDDGWHHEKQIFALIDLAKDKKYRAFQNIQNALIALGSKTGMLNKILLPVSRFIWKRMYHE